MEREDFREGAIIAGGVIVGLAGFMILSNLGVIGALNNLAMRGRNLLPAA